MITLPSRSDDPANPLGGPMDQAFRDAISAGYGFDEPTLIIGSAMLGDELFNDVRVAVPMSTLNRHGLVAGATGTGKTKTLQVPPGQPPTTQGTPHGPAL